MARAFSQNDCHGRCRSLGGLVATRTRISRRRRCKDAACDLEGVMTPLRPLMQSSDDNWCELGSAPGQESTRARVQWCSDSQRRWFEGANDEGWVT